MNTRAVYTPRRLAERARQEGWFDAEEIRNFLTRSLEPEEASTWAELGERLARIEKWEFEDYRE